MRNEAKLVVSPSDKLVYAIDLEFTNDPKFDDIVVDLMKSTLNKLRINTPCTIPVSLGKRSGYDRKTRRIEIPTSIFVSRGGFLSLSRPSQFRKFLVQLIGIWLWDNRLSRQEKTAYAGILSELPVRGQGTPDHPEKPLFKQDSLRDFAISFERYWNGRLEKQRRSWIHSVFVSKKTPFDPKTAPPQLSEPRLPSPERKMPIPGRPFTPDAN